MKIALLHYSAPPIIGGVESVLASQAEILTRSGHQVTVLAGRGAAWQDDIRVELLPLLDSRHERILNIKAALDQGRQPDDFEPAAAEIQAGLEHHLQDMDVLIAHNVAALHKNLPLTSALERIAAGRANGLRIILWHHDFAWTAGQYNGEMHPGYPWELTCGNWPNVIQVVVSEARRQELARLAGVDPASIQVVPAGIDQAELLGLPDDVRALAARLDLFSADPLLLTPVRITRRKNLEFALRVLDILREHLPAAQLVVTGPTGAHNPSNQVYFDDLLALRRALRLEGAVHFLAERYPDGLSDQQVAAFFRLADALLMTSSEEGFGIPILEAGLSRMPIFCSNLAPLKALAGAQGCYFELSHPPAQVAAQIAARLERDPLYQMRSRVRREYTWEAVYRTRIEPLFSPQPHFLQKESP